jgi:predicted lipoprotein with Yx(FWY)xxD motif
MKIPKQIFPFAIILLLTVIVAACGSSTGAGPYGGSTPAATTSSSNNASVVLKTATATVSGKTVTILTNDKGFTLYYLKADTATKVACSGSCAKIWPPLLQTGSGIPTGPESLPGKLSAFSSANGNQVEYNGHPLYTYTGDTAPGQTNGEGFKGVWFVVSSDLQQQGKPPSGY